MCSGYDQTAPNEGQLNVKNIVHWMKVEAEGLHRTEGVHPRGKGLVVAHGRTHEPTAVVMHWGTFKPGIILPVFSARTESLGSPTWAKARRCVIPVERFYMSDWQGEKWSFYSFRPLWLAGVWENHPEHGLCYSIVHKPAEAPVTKIHDRMPCCLSDDEAFDYLHGERPAARILTVSLQGLPTEPQGKRRRK